MIMITILVLSFVQNVAFTLVSRARNRNHAGFHATASVFSNGIWFLTMQQLVVAELTTWLLVPYVVGTVTGSLLGARVSQSIERTLGAST